MIFRLLEHVVRQFFPRYPIAKKIERRRARIIKSHGPRFPAGTACWMSRARPDCFLFFEFDDGSVIEVSPGCGFAAEEMPPSLDALELVYALRMMHLMMRETRGA